MHRLKISPAGKCIIPEMWQTKKKTKTKSAGKNTDQQHNKPK